jgi:hypothetical protein
MGQVLPQIGFRHGRYRMVFHGGVPVQPVNLAARAGSSNQSPKTPITATIRLTA